jgi:WD40 repeat protein
VQVWDLSKKPPLERPFPDQVSLAIGMPALSADGKRLFTFHLDGKCRLWDLSAPTGALQLLSEWKVPEDCLCPAFAPNGASVAYSTSDQQVVWRRVPDGKLLRSWTFPGQIKNLIFSPDGRHLTIANPNGTIYLLRLAHPDGTPYPST